MSCCVTFAGPISTAPDVSVYSARLLQAGARLCKALGPEFLSYLPTVMPQLMTAAKLEPELKVGLKQRQSWVQKEGGLLATRGVGQPQTGS